ncbi:MAG: hypothetical protein JXD23_14455 [Spirochaetales bacterium]|nr:hypothetical protein [Spirochaetales bacterium]
MSVGKKDERSGAQQRIAFYQRKEFPPLAVFGGFLVILLLSTAFSGRPPSITRVTQEDNLAAEIVTITGSHFGAAGTGGEVRIGDLALADANYLSWNDNEIVVSIPREISSGIIYVVTKDGKCRGDIYMNVDEIPRLASNTSPLIESLSSTNVAPGRVVVVKGKRFGAERGNSRVSFSEIVPEGLRGESLGQSEVLVSASDADGDYISWSDNEIHVRVPDGAKTGPVMVVTGKGESNNVLVRVMSPVGRREYGGRTRYRLRFDARVSCDAAEAPNRLRLLVPRPVDCPEQRGFKAFLKPGEPLAAPPAGPLEITLTDLAPGGDESVSVEFTVDRYSVTTEIDPGLVVDYDRTAPFYRAFTGDDASLAPSHPALPPLLREAAGSEKNPYLAARKIYDFVIDRFTPEETPAVPISPVAVPNWYAVCVAKTGGPFVYASLFASLARKAGIPARLVAGYLVDARGAANPHYWSEFFLEDFGWVPVDPYLGEGRTSEPPPSGGDRRNSYFGDLDNRHIAFAKGYCSIDKSEAQARIAVRPGVVGLQPFYEEASAGIKSYTSSWQPVTVIEMK